LNAASSSFSSLQMIAALPRPDHHHTAKPSPLLLFHFK
jgi:hypothetical protein